MLAVIFITTYNAFFGGTFYVGNMPDMYLPLTGGLGRNMIVAAGVVAFMVAAAGAVWLVFRKQKIKAE